MLRCHGKNKLNDHQDHMHSLEPSKPTTEGCSYYSVAEAQEKRLENKFHERNRGAASIQLQQIEKLERRCGLGTTQHTGDLSE